MNSDSPSTIRAPRLNPFAFPSDTDFRFVLLIATVLGASLFYYFVIHLQIPVMGQRWIDAVQACFEGVYGQEIDPASVPTTSPELAARYIQCTTPVEREKAGWIAGGVALLLGVAGIIYWTFPIWKIRRDRLTPLSAEDAPEVVACVTDLYRKTGLSRPPSLLWNPLNPASGGLVFGRLGRYSLALTGGLVTQFYTDRPAFRAVILHELAHLRNADIDKTYFAVAVWQAFILAAIVPYTVFVMVNGRNALSLLTSTGWKVAVLAALVYLTRNAVLRAREIYADARATTWDGPDGALGRVLEGLPRPKAGRWQSVLRVHPDPTQRRRMLDDTDRLFRMDFWVAVGTGLAIMIALPTVSIWLGLLHVMTLELKFIASALIFAPVVVGVVGLGVWRATFAALARGRESTGVGSMALGLGLGLLLGEPLNFGRITATDPFGSQPTPIGLAFTFAFTLLWSGLLMTISFFFLRWMAASASAWLEVAATYRSPRPIYTLGLTIAGGMFAVWFGVLLLIREASGLLLLAPVMTIVGLHHPLTFLALASLWAFPLAAWFWRRRVAVETSWAFLDSFPEPLTLPPLPPLRPGLALGIGVTGGSVFCGLLFVAHLAWSSVSEAARSTDEYKLLFFTGQVVLAALIQAGVAAVAAGWVRRLGAVHGLFAAFAAGCVMTVGVLGLNLLFGGTIDALYAWTTFSQVVNWGALLALPAAVGTSALTGWARRSRPPAAGERRRVIVAAS